MDTISIVENLVEDCLNKVVEELERSATGDGPLIAQSPRPEVCLLFSSLMARLKPWQEIVPLKVNFNFRAPSGEWFFKLTKQV